MAAPSKAHLIVDGFNIAHAWSDVERLFASGLDAVVEAMTARLREIHDGRQMQVTVVFDGQGDELDLRSPFADATFALAFSPRSLTADAVIERMVAASGAKEETYVASQDRIVVDAVEALGAAAVSASALADWLEGCRRESRRQLQKRSDASNLSWGNRLPL